MGVGCSPVKFSEFGADVIVVRELAKILKRLQSAKFAVVVEGREAVFPPSLDVECSKVKAETRGVLNLVFRLEQVTCRTVPMSY